MRQERDGEEGTSRQQCHSVVDGSYTPSEQTDISKSGSSMINTLTFPVKCRVSGVT